MQKIVGAFHETPLQVNFLLWTLRFPLRLCSVGVLKARKPRQVPTALREIN